MLRCIAIALVLFSTIPSCLAQAPPPPSKNPLDLLDSLFVPAYNSRTAALNATNPPYVEVFGSSLFLHLRGQATIPVRVLTDPYHHLKDVAHAPFTIYLSLAGLANAPLSDAQLAPIHEISARLSAAETTLPTAGFDPMPEKRQREILDASMSLVNKVLTNRAVDQDEVKQFARAMAPLMLENADEAGCFQVQATHQRMMQWKSSMTEPEWQSLRVVIKNSHQARYRNAATQYFSWLLDGSTPAWGYPGENSRVVYAEALGKDQSAGDELLGVLVDFDASRAFFGDDWRMTEDILSKGAARCIAQLSPSDRAWSPATSPTTAGAK
jgi:hypothetical protein